MERIKFVDIIMCIGLLLCFWYVIKQKVCTYKYYFEIRKKKPVFETRNEELFTEIHLK